MIKKPKAKFELQNGGGSYKLKIYLIENVSENQNAWADAQDNIVFDYQLNGVVADLKKDGFITSIIK